MTIFSFHTQKLMTTLGEGGALTTDDVEAAKRLRELRQFGGASGWGSNYKLTKVQAAVGMIQLRKLDEMTGLRRQRALERTAMLQGIPEITLPHDPQDRWHTYYLYTCLVPKEWAGEKRDRLNAMMVEDFGIGCVVANPPTHQTIPFIRENAVNLDLPVSDELASRLTCVSLHPLMTEEDNEYICAALWECVERIRAGE